MTPIEIMHTAHMMAVRRPGKREKKKARVLHDRMAYIIVGSGSLLRYKKEPPKFHGRRLILWNR